MTVSKNNIAKFNSRAGVMIKMFFLFISKIYCKVKKIVVRLFQRFQALDLPLKIAASAGCCVIFIVVLIVLFSGQNKSSPLKNTALSVPKTQDVTSVKQFHDSSSITGGVNDDLSDLQAKLANIETMLSSRRSVVNIDKVRNDIHELTQEITLIERENKTQYSALRSQISLLSSQLGSYQKTTSDKLDEIEAVKNKVKCLNASHLPFTVQSIDMVNGRNVVSVLYAKMVSPLENDFTLAGWKLTTSDYEHQTARFVNREGVCAGVNLTSNF